MVAGILRVQNGPSVNFFMGTILVR